MRETYPPRIATPDESDAAPVSAPSVPVSAASAPPSVPVPAGPAPVSAVPATAAARASGAPPVRRLTRREWTRIGVMAGFVVLLHVLGFFSLFAVIAP